MGRGGLSYIGKAITGAISVGSDYFSPLGITRATIADGLVLNTPSDPTRLNRDEGRMQEVLGEKKRVSSLMIPITTPERIRESNERIGQMMDGLRQKMNKRFAQAKMEARTGEEREGIEEIETAYAEQEAMLRDAWMRKERYFLRKQWNKPLVRN